jgi:hypothetical protein
MKRITTLLIIALSACFFIISTPAFAEKAQPIRQPAGNHVDIEKISIVVQATKKLLYGDTEHLQSAPGILNNYTILAPETWYEEYTKAYHMGMSINGQKTVIKTTVPWNKEDAANASLLRIMLSKHELIGYAIEYHKNGMLVVKDCYRLFDTPKYGWEKLGTITPNGGKKYVLFAPIAKNKKEIAEN